MFISKYICIAITLIVSFGVYLNTLSNDFVSDDVPQIMENLWIKDVKYIPQIFLSDIWGFMGEGNSHYYRPLIHIVYMVDYYIFGLKPWGFHLSYILFHAGASALVFLIAFALFDKLPSRHSLNPLAYNLMPAFAASLFFATHPINTEAVDLGGPDPLFTFFYLLSFYLYINVDGVWRKRFILSIVFFFLATLCKETAITLPILILVYDYSFKKDFSLRLSPHAFYALFKRYLPYLIIAGVYFAIRTHVIGGFIHINIKRHAELSNYQYFINVFPLFIQYLEKLVFPINLNVFHVFHPISSIFEWKGIIAGGITLLFIFIAYLFRKNRVVFFSLLWMVIPLLPVFYIPALGENTFTERYLYLPSVGFVLLASFLIKNIYQFRPLGHITGGVVISTVIILALLYSMGTIKRNYAYKDDYTLWLDTVERSPDAHVAHNNLGVAYGDKGQYDMAIKDYNMAIALDPNYSDAYNNRGVAYDNKGQYDMAIEDYTMAIALNPNYSDAYYNRGLAYGKKGQYGRAIEDFNKAIVLNQSFAQTYNNRGLAYYYKGQYGMAIENYNKAIALNPNLAQAYNNRGLAYDNKGHYDMAIEDYKKACDMGLGVSCKSLQNLVKMLQKTGGTF